MSSFRGLKKRTHTVLTLLALSPLVALALPSSPDVWAANCSGGSQSEVWGSCSSGAPGRTVSNPMPGTKWHVVDDFGKSQPCINRSGQASWRAIMYGTTPSGRTVWPQPQPYCLARYGQTGGTAQRAAQIKPPKPVIKADFGERFLVNAPVQFSLDVDNKPGEQTQILQPVDQNAEYRAWLELTAINYRWQFSDGTTSSEARPVKSFTSVSPDPANPDRHVAGAKVTVTWKAVLRIEDQNTTDLNPTNVNLNVQELGELPVEGELYRPIVGVWSAQTEPIPNA